ILLPYLSGRIFLVRLVVLAKVHDVVVRLLLCSLLLSTLVVFLLFALRHLSASYLLRSRSQPFRLRKRIVLLPVRRL
ncbi:hypothetical protein PMAYCL1PPCAC_19040, partial [Pristionchus mayeri]